MTNICLCFEVHQPVRINRSFNKKDAEGKEIDDLYNIYFNNTWNKEILERVAKKCYLSANELMIEKINQYSDRDRKFKVAYSISGSLILQLKKWYPEVLESFKKLGETGCVEFLDQTYYHSLASLYDEDKREFRDQVKKHREAVKDLFGQEPQVFENTEFIYNNSIAKVLEEMGYRAIFTEGANRILGWRSPNYVYKAKDSDILVFPRNYMLSDDIAFRFSNRDWPEWPLTADKYANWLSSIQGDCINIFIDYETFGEHQWPETGIYDFLYWLPDEILKHPNLNFVTPSELVGREPVGEIDVHDFNTVSWADTERSINAWMSNDMQLDCYRKLKNLESKVKRTEDERILEIWRLLQISDHLYYIYTTPGASKEVHGYFSQQTPKEVYLSFSAILSDFEKKVDRQLREKRKTSSGIPI